MGLAPAWVAEGSGAPCFPRRAATSSGTSLKGVLRQAGHWAPCEPSRLRSLAPAVDKPASQCGGFAPGARVSTLSVFSQRRVCVHACACAGDRPSGPEAEERAPCTELLTSALPRAQHPILSIRPCHANGGSGSWLAWRPWTQGTLQAQQFTWFFSIYGGILELRRGIQAASCVGPGKSNLPFELRRKAGDCSRVTAGPIDLI